MIKTKIKDPGRAFAILAGLGFLFCALMKILATLFPAFAYLHDLWIYEGEVYYMQIDELCAAIEIIALIGLAAICFSMKRTAALLFPIGAFAFTGVKLIIDTVWFEASSLITSSRFDLFSLLSAVFTVLSASALLIALLLLAIQIAINVSCKKFVVPLIFLILLAVLSIPFSIAACGSYLTNDVLQLFTAGTLDKIDNGLSGYAENLIVPIFDNLTKLLFTIGIFFYAIWMIFRAKSVDVEIVDKKVLKAQKKANRAAAKEAKKSDKIAAKEAKKSVKAAEKATKEAEKAAKKEKKEKKNNKADDKFIETTATEEEAVAPEADAVETSMETENDVSEEVTAPKLETDTAC